VLGHAPDSSFLATQVPAMADAAMMLGLGEADFEGLLDRFSQEPEASFEATRCLLFDVSRELLRCADADAAATVLERAADDDLAALLYHYELPTWVLYARCYGKSLEPNEAVRAVDGQLRAADDSLEWLTENWLRDP
jgi:hypothetical protein